ncbi:MAG: hypothetical protein RLZZ385_2542 [Pseudomonadota bacterium]|jgi:thiamine biosynthesis protein ThiI
MEHPIFYSTFMVRTPMLFIVKLFPEITIKSRPVRRRLIQQLRNNLRSRLRHLDTGVRVSGAWDYIEVELQQADSGIGQEVLGILLQTPGIANIQQVSKFPLVDLADIARHCRLHFGADLAGKTFAVRCKRSGQHDFRSMDVEKTVGAVLLTELPAAGVDLDDPQVTVRLEIRQQAVYLVTAQYRGLGGFPLGSQDAVLSLISGGFDSAVASYLCIRRGLLTHYLFFNLGGREHEVAVQEVARFLWQKYASSHNVKFVSVPFEGVVEQILTKVADSHMGVVLKRMMLRAADRMAERLGIAALVTGESIAQVSSQTVANLSVIDRVSERLILRPLITTDKQDIIDLARQIGTEAFSKDIPEYCGVISVRPTTHARLQQVEAEEARFDFGVLDAAVSAARIQSMQHLRVPAPGSVPQIEVTDTLQAGDRLIDIRDPHEEAAHPLQQSAQGVELVKVPFYRLSGYMEDQDRDSRYLLYCEHGVMSRLHAASLFDRGFHKVAIFKPRKIKTSQEIPE